MRENPDSRERAGSDFEGDYMDILLVDDEDLSRRAIGNFLERHLGYQVQRCADAGEALEALSERRYPLVLTDIRMPGMDGLELLKTIKASEYGVDTEVILFTGFADVTSAVSALRQGAFDYLRKPLNVEELAQVLERLEEKLQKDGDAGSDSRFASGKKTAVQSQLPDKRTMIELPEIGTIGIYSAKMKELVKTAYTYHQDRTVPVLIEGETGTGKEIVARLIHYGSGDEDSPFISINCSSISPHLFESELFGYESGSFTGAKKAGSRGKMELAQGGTLFLDEIGDMPLEMQPKLLRALQEREIYRIGGQNRIRLDIRVICATNRNLEREIDEGNFRQDLYYRLNLGRIFIPPLREQQEAIASLAMFMLARFAERKNKRFKYIDHKAYEILENYEWSGNVRELQNVIERVVLLYDGEKLLAEHLDFLKSGTGVSVSSSAYVLGEGSFSLPEDGLDIEGFEAEIVRKAYRKSGSNKSKTAEYLGLTRSALRSRLKKVFPGK